MIKNKSFAWVIPVIFTVAAVLCFYVLYLPNCNFGYIKDTASYIRLDTGDSDESTERFSSYEESLASIGVTPEKVWDYDDTVYAYDYEYLREKDKYVVECYEIERKDDSFSAPKNTWEFSSGGPNSLYDAHWIDTDLIRGDIIWLVFNYEAYIDGKGKYNDVVAGIYYGNMLPELTFDVGEFDCQKLGRSEHSDYDIYFWTYELKNLRSTLESACKKVEIEAPYGSYDAYEFRVKDIQKVLGMHATDPHFGMRQVGYLLALITILALAVLFTIKSHASGTEKKSSGAEQRIFMIFAGIMSFIGVFLLLFFIYNPHLTLGELRTNGIIHEITGKYINDIHGHYR